uniref:Uncharacterized protein n=1 Tax=Timema tahoe TaxID=61484 RepID=A0A7R9IN42_9NEOP|nr:unnamed protein product [Timema tahoe]
MAGPPLLGKILPTFVDRGRHVVSTISPPPVNLRIPEIDVPPIEPMNIPRMAMENGNGAVRIRAVFSNMTAHGASNYTVLSLKTDLDDYRIDMGLEIPRIEALGKYDVSGNILLFPVRSRGEFTAIFREAMNQFLNQNANEIIKEMKPAAAHSIGRHFKEFLNTAFLKIPINVWLLDA